MDYNNGIELFQWQKGEPFLQEESALDISDLTWDGDTQEEDFSYMLEETTPVKACGGSPYNLSYGKRRKETDECQVTSSRLKRRRTLQFGDEDLNLSSQIDDHVFLKAKENLDVFDEAFSERSQQEVGFQEIHIQSSLHISEASSFTGLECLDQVEDWLGDCFNYSETHNPSSANMNSCDTTDLLIDITDIMNSPPTMAANPVQKQTVRSSPNVTFKGTKSSVQRPTKLASFTVHPFTFIKPSEVNGDVTLKEINQRIRPPQIKPKKDDRDPTFYGTSAITGKPVVNKTRIRTEGGQGSITIMRTKG